MDIFTKNDIDSYIDSLVNQAFSILPIFEKSGNSDFLSRKIDNLCMRMQGFFELNNFDHSIAIEILSFTNSLKMLHKHSEIRKCVLKICSMLSSLKVVNQYDFGLLSIN